MKGALVISLALVLSACQQPIERAAARHYTMLPTFPFWRIMDRFDTAAILHEIDSLDLVLSSDTFNAPAFLRRGQLKFTRSGDLGLSDYNKAIALDSTLALAYFSRGVVFQFLESRHIPFRGCNDIRKAVELGFQVPNDLPDLWGQCLVQNWDTLEVGYNPNATTKFISLSAFLFRSSFDEEEKHLIKDALVAKQIPIDSMWVPLAGADSRDTAVIELALYHHSGILEEILVNSAGMLRAGNGSGMDGTLTIDKVTGRSSFLLWQ